MQQIPKHEQHLFGRLTGVMGESFTLYEPESLRECLRRGAARVNHPFSAGPFYVQLPLNVQPRRIPRLGLAALPALPTLARVATVDEGPSIPCWARPVRSLLSHRARSACCPTRIPATCTWAAARARSAETTPWRMPTC